MLRNSGDGTFSKNVDYPTGTSPQSVAAADFNGDGWIDLATADNSIAGKVSVLLNNRDGTFSTRKDYDTAAFAFCLIAGDLNGDGKSDLAVASRTTNGSVNVLLGNGDGTFAPSVSYATGANTNFVASLDIDADGKLDLAVSNFDSSTLSILRNNGDGTFAPKVDYVTGTNPDTVSTADFDGDGRPDLVTSHENGHYLSVFRNLGDGTFAQKVDYGPLSGGYMYVAAADLNSDGRPELITSNQSGVISVWKNNGSGAFATSVDYVAGSGLFTVMTADFNSDAKLDVAVVSSTSVTVLTNNGDGTLLDGNSYVPGRSPRSLAAGDIDGDGWVDMVVANNNGTTAGLVTVLRNNRDGTFVATASYPTDSISSSPGSVALADFNGDGKPDIAEATGSKTVSVLLNNGDGTFSRRVSYLTTFSAVSLSAADVNGDAKPDLAVVNDSGTVSILMNNGDGTFAVAVNYSVGQNPSYVVIADWDGDGKPDLAVANATSLTSGTVSILRNKGAGTFATKVDYDAGASAHAVAALDVNGDGKLDLAVTGTFLYVLRNKGDGTFAAKTLVSGASATLFRAFDLNNDGKLDLVGARGTDAVALVNNGDGSFTPAVTYAVGGAAQDIVAADFDGDGRPDIATANYTGGTVTVLRNVTTEAVPPSVGSMRFNFDGRPQSLSAQFSEWVNSAVGLALTVTNLTTGQTVEAADLAYRFDAVANVGIWTFPGMPQGRLPNGNYSVSLAASGVKDSSGNQMLLDFTAECFALTADINRDRVVDFLDLAILAQSYNTVGGMTWANGDINGDGNVDFYDLVLMAQNYNVSVPAIQSGQAVTSSVSLNKVVTLPTLQPRPIKRPDVPLLPPHSRRSSRR